MISASQIRDDVEQGTSTDWENKILNLAKVLHQTSTVSPLDIDEKIPSMFPE